MGSAEKQENNSYPGLGTTHKPYTIPDSFYELLNEAHESNLRRNVRSTWSPATQGVPQSQSTTNSHNPSSSSKSISSKVKKEEAYEELNTRSYPYSNHSEYGLSNKMASAQQESGRTAV